MCAMAKRKNKIGKNDLTESTLYRAMMKKKYQQSNKVGDPPYSIYDDLSATKDTIGNFRNIYNKQLAIKASYTPNQNPKYQQDLNELNQQEINLLKASSPQMMNLWDYIQGQTAPGKPINQFNLDPLLESYYKKMNPQSRGMYQNSSKVKKMYQESNQVGDPPAWMTGDTPAVDATGGVPLTSDITGRAYDAAGNIDPTMSAENYQRMAGTETSSNPYAAIGQGAELVGGAIEGASNPGNRGKRSFGQAAGSSLASAGKGAAAGAGIGTLIGGPVGTAAGAVIGGAIGLGAGIVGNIGASKRGKSAYEQGVVGAAEQTMQQDEARSQATREASRMNMAPQQEVMAYNAFGENLLPGQTQEEQYAMGGRIGSLMRYEGARENSEKSLRERLNDLRKNIKTSGGMGMDIRRGNTGQAYGAGIGGGASANIGKFGLGFGGGMSPQYGPEGFAGLGYGGGFNATYAPNPNIQLHAGIGTGGMINRQGASTPQFSPNVGIRANFKRGGMVKGCYEGGGDIKKSYYETGGNIEDQYTDALNNIAQGYIPPAARQNKNQFAQQIGPNREITEPGSYQVNGKPHEEGGTMETVPTINGPETAEFDDKEFLDTTVTVGGMETFAFNNHGGDKDADKYASIQKEFDKVQKELELIGEMNPEYAEEIKKALS